MKPPVARDHDDHTDDDRQDGTFDENIGKCCRGMLPNRGLKNYRCWFELGLGVFVLFIHRCTFPELERAVGNDRIAQTHTFHDETKSSSSA